MTEDLMGDKFYQIIDQFEDKGKLLHSSNFYSILLNEIQLQFTIYNLLNTIL